MLEVLFGQMPLISGIPSPACNGSLSGFLQESQALDLALLICHVLRLDLDQSRPRVVRPTRVYATTQIPKPSRSARGVYVGHFTSKTDPILCAAILEGDQSSLMGMQVFELWEWWLARK